MIDYQKIGLKVGIELHRQLNTKKLFCSCPSLLRDDKPDLTITRKLHAVASEMKEKDTVAEFEMSKGKYAVYEAYKDTICLVELDEEPIQPINQEALEIALQICKMLNCNIVDEVQIMRKQVLDYSNTSGFQRTCMIGYDGYVETSSGRVGISTVMLEEDAARKISDDKEKVVYRLDRLGIPLIEISTAPDIKNPSQAREVAAYLGMVLKSTGKVKSGIGTVRQDVNVSIQGHGRVEIKGVQELALIEKAVEKEAERQLNELKQKKIRSEVRKVNEDGTTTFLRPMPGAARLYPETDVGAINISNELIKKIVIPKLVAEHTKEIEQKYGLSKELAHQVREMPLFFEFLNKYPKIEPTFIAKVLVEMPKELKARFKLDSSKITEKEFSFILEAVYSGKVSRDAALSILAELAQGKKVELSKYQEVSSKELGAFVEKIIKDKPGMSFNAYMGEVMKRFSGKVSGKSASECIRALIEKR